MINKILSNRWSPRAFKKYTINNEEVSALFEAARWAPSSMNEQPWTYYYALNGEDAFEKFIDCLMPGNQSWARNASMLILSVAGKRFNHKNRPNRHAMHDVGAANISLALQAADLGLQAHQMGGFAMDRTLEVFELDIMDSEPVSFIAVGKPGDPDQLEKELRKREEAPRERKKISEFVKHF